MYVHITAVLSGSFMNSEERYIVLERMSSTVLHV